VNGDGIEKPVLILENVLPATGEKLHEPGAFRSTGS
jgi:hypothetical protein